MKGANNMKDFKVVITTVTNETVAYMVQAKNEMFAKCAALIRYDKAYKDKTKSILVTVI